MSSERSTQSIVGRAGAFTLIELLVVIGLVGLLASMVFPATQRALLQAKRAKCASNLRQIGLAIHAYAHDRDGLLPPTTHSTGGRPEGAWIDVLRPYLRNAAEVLICPADPRAKERRAAGASSYIANNIVFDAQRSPFGTITRAYNNLYSLSAPALVLFAAPISDSRAGISPVNDHTHAEAWSRSWANVIADIEPNRFRLGPSDPLKLNGDANYLFGDASVRNIPAARLREDFSAGHNFAYPGGMP